MDVPENGGGWWPKGPELPIFILRLVCCASLGSIVGLVIAFLVGGR